MVHRYAPPIRRVICRSQDQGSGCPRFSRRLNNTITVTVKLGSVNVKINPSITTSICIVADGVSNPTGVNLLDTDMANLLSPHCTTKLRTGYSFHSLQLRLDSRFRSRPQTADRTSQATAISSTGIKTGLAQQQHAPVAVLDTFPTSISSSSRSPPIPNPNPKPKHKP
jgi:hypothetical protein